MSLTKWTLALAGTALGLRYMSDRHRRRTADSVAPAMPMARSGSPDAGTPWAATQGGMGSSQAAGSAHLDDDAMPRSDAALDAGALPARF